MDKAFHWLNFTSKAINAAFSLRAKKLPEYKKEDITVIIPVKNRSCRKLINALKSIRNQNYSQRLIDIKLVDYDSERRRSSQYKLICKEYDTEFIRVDNKRTWCKSNAYNIAIKRLMSKYILASDADIIFENNYIKEGIEELRKDPFRVILNVMRDLPEGYLLKEFDFRVLKDLAVIRFDSPFHAAIPLTSTYFLKEMRGYDEKYLLWGSEDEDLIKRLMLLGVRIKVISDRTAYFHQWHPKFCGVRHLDYLKQSKINEEYCESNDSILRNEDGWGN